MKKVKNANSPGLHLITLGKKYIYLVKNIIEENINSGQAPIIYFEKEPSAEEILKKQRWHFNNIIIPMLFNFYHGLEITIKGFLGLKKDYRIEPKHTLSILLKDFINNYPELVDMIIFFEKYIIIEKMPDYLKRWFVTQNMSIDDYYLFLRYPLNRNFTENYDYFDLKYDLGGDGINLSKDMHADIEKFLIKSVQNFNFLEINNLYS